MCFCCTFNVCFLSGISAESFLLSLRKPASGPNNAAPAAPSAPSAPSAPPPFLQSGSPPSSPSWALLSNRPPGLKTYRSSSRGALKLTIKHESGSRKVVHNSACDSAPSAPFAPSLHKQDCTGRLTNGGGLLSGRGSELWEPPHPQSGHPQPSAHPQPPPSSEEAQRPKNSGGVTEAQAAANSRTPPDSLATAEPQTVAAPEPPAPDPILCPPEPKRPRPDPPPAPLSPQPLPEDSTLSEHLQSAIDSILELQRLQGPPALQARPPQDRRGTSVLEQAVSSILEGHL